MIPTAPFRVRNRLAETILRALGDPQARRDLASIALDADAQDVVRERARRAAEALAESPFLGGEPSLDQTLAAAGVLFDAGLHFEVHEVLEPYWARATGAERQALQGLIQIAVGYQHLANDNLEGARALLAEGPDRLRAGRLAGLDLTPFADAVSAAAARIGHAVSIDVPAFPRGSLRREKWISS
jgi:DUF309 family protein family protein